MLQYISDWLASPLKTSGNAGDWFLFVGLLLASIYLWKIIARDFDSLA
jgi:hypothetical protein